MSGWTTTPRWRWRRRVLVGPKLTKQQREHLQATVLYVMQGVLGKLVRHVPPFNEWADVVIWGERVFQLVTVTPSGAPTTYRECFTVAVVQHTFEDGEGSTP